MNFKTIPLFIFNNNIITMNNNKSENVSILFRKYIHEIRNMKN